MGNVQASDSSNIRVIPLTDKWFREARVTTSAKKHLLRSLKSLVKAKDPTPSFKLYGSSDVSVVKRFLNSVAWDKLDIPAGWKEYEYDRLKKFGGQGGHPAWSDMWQLMTLYVTRPQKVKYVDPEVMGLIKDIYHQVFPAPLRVLPVDEGLALLVATDKIFEKAAGCRDFDLKKTDTLAQFHAIRDVESGLLRKFRMYVFERFQKNKPRIFMPGPFANMLEQASFLVPKMLKIQDDLRSQLEECPLYHFGDKIGFDNLFLKIMPGKLHQSLISLKQKVLGSGRKWDPSKVICLYIQGDFEKMDTTTGVSQYENIYLPIIQEAYDEKDRAHIRNASIQTVKMPIITPSGVIIDDHGTGSGMENTNDGEGNCNLYYGKRTEKLYAIKMRRRLPNVLYEFAGDYYNGDDSSRNILLYDITDQQLASIEQYYMVSALQAAAECGFRINEKWRMDTHFGLYNQNGYWFKWDTACNVTCHYMYPAALILNSIINPEKEYSKATWDKDYRDIDVVEKLDNGRYLPYYHELVHYVDNGMKFPLLGRTEPETSRILSKYERYRALQSLDERYNRQDWTLSNSETLKYVLSYRHRR